MGFCVETQTVPTIDPTVEVVDEKKSAGFDMSKYNEDLYDGPGLEIPNLIDVLKPKIKKNKTPEISQEEVDKPKQSATLDAEQMEYFEDRNEIEARGNVVIKTYPDETKLSADKAIYNRDKNVIRLFGNVVLDKNDSVIQGDFMSIDLNEENVLMNEPFGTMNTLTIRAQEGYAYANEIQTINGEAQMAKDIEMLLQSKGFGYYDETIVDKDLVTPHMKKRRSEPLKIKTREIIIESKKEHETITFKDLEIYYKKFKIAKADSAEILTDKSQSYIETNLPEVGMIRDFGTYIAWGYATEVPFGGTLKVMPALVYDSGLGVGLIGRYRSKRNFLEAAYATSSENLIVRGKYNFTKDLYLDYGRHAYVDEWYYGRRRSGYIAQLAYDKTYSVKDLNARFKHRISGGYVTDWAEKESENRNGTMRLRYQSELSKIFYEIKNDEQDMYLRLGAYAQAGATLYGTGDVVGIARFGPMLHTRVKNWGSRISYGMAGVHNESPLVFDRYIYGKQYLTVDENIRLGKYLALGYQGTISLLKDNPEGDLLTENKFYVIAGPEDMKVSLAYDSYRERALLDFMFLVGSDNSKIKYDKLSIKNMDKAGKKQSPFDNFKYYRVQVPDEL